MKVGGAGGAAWPLPDYSQPVDNRGTDATQGATGVQGADGVEDVDPSKKLPPKVEIPDGYEGATGTTPATEALQDPKLQFPPDDLVPDAGDVDGTDPTRGALDPSRSGKVGAAATDGVDGLDPARDVDPTRDADPAQQGRPGDLEDGLFGKMMEVARLSGDEEDQIKNLQTWQGGGTDGRLDHFIKRMGLHSVLGGQDAKTNEADDATKVQAARDTAAGQNNTPED